MSRDNQNRELRPRSADRVWLARNLESAERDFDALSREEADRLLRIADTSARLRAFLDLRSDWAESGDRLADDDEARVAASLVGDPSGGVDAPPEPSPMVIADQAVPAGPPAGVGAQAVPGAGKETLEVPLQKRVLLARCARDGFKVVAVALALALSYQIATAVMTGVAGGLDQVLLLLKFRSASLGDPSWWLRGSFWAFGTTAGLFCVVRVYQASGHTGRLSAGWPWGLAALVLFILSAVSPFQPRFHVLVERLAAWPERADFSSTGWQASIDPAAGEWLVGEVVEPFGSESWPPEEYGLLRTVGWFGAPRSWYVIRRSDFRRALERSPDDYAAAPPVHDRHEPDG